MHILEGVDITLRDKYFICLHYIIPAEINVFIFIVL